MNDEFQITTAAVLLEMLERFPRQEIKPSTLKAYEEDLADIDPQHLALVCRQLWRSTEWFPSVNAIRRAYFDLLFGSGAAAEAWEKVLRWTRSGRRPNPTSHKTVRPEAADGFDAITLKAVALMPWSHMWDGTEERYLRKDFFTNYEQARKELADTFAREGMLGIEPSIGDGAVPALGGGR